MSELKRRVKRIDPGYYKVRDPIARWKLWLAAVAATVCGGWLVVEAVSEMAPTLGLSFQTNQRLYSRGPLSRPHASWNDRCEVCHESFTPLSGQAEWARNAIGLTTPNGKCESCHAGAVHHPNRKEPDANCASCHQEHRGTHASLIAEMEHTCVRCHGDLEAHVADKSRLDSASTRIDGFADAGRPGSHPDFRSLASDPGRVKFSHYAHLHPDAHGPKLWELDRVIQVKDPQKRKEALDRYRPFVKDGVVRLDCAACHVVEAEDTGISRDDFSAYEIPNTREHRRYMAPIRFENQCRACHPTRVDRDVAQPASAFEVPHGVQPADVERFLFAYRDGNTEKVADDLRQIFPRGQGGFFACGRCHQYRVDEGQWRPERIEPAAIPEFWLIQGVFDHTAHRAFACDLCHPAARESTKTSDVLIEGINNCRKCHSPGGTEQSGFFHHARSDCLTCHTYHNAGNPLQGPGAFARGRKASEAGPHGQ